MELEELRPILIERYVAGGYERDRAEAVIDAAFEAHRDCVAARTARSQAACAGLQPGIERTDCLGTILSLEMQHTNMMLCVLNGTRTQTVQ